MLVLKQRWLERRPLKPGEMMQMGTPEWMKNHSDYKEAEDRA
jgi:hypothetical protein